MIYVTTTCASYEDASYLAKIILEAKLAFCIHIDEIESMYLWEGEIKSGKEFRLIIKSYADYYFKLEHFIKINHKYQIPQITMSLIHKSSDEYRKWAESIKQNLSIN